MDHLSAERLGVIEDVRPIEIHGQRFYEIMFRYEDGPSGGDACRLSWDQVPEDLKAGDRVKVKIILSTVVGMERAS